jgi:hypothetical protein
MIPSLVEQSQLKVERTSKPTYVNDIRGSQAFKEGAYLGLQYTGRCAQSSPLVLVLSGPLYIGKDSGKGKEAPAPSHIKEIREMQGGQEAPHNGGAISPKDA